MKAAMMLTAEGHDALALARRLRDGLPDAEWTAFVRAVTLLPELTRIEQLPR